MEEKKKGKTLLCTFIVLFLLAVVAWTAYKAGRESRKRKYPEYSGSWMRSWASFPA